VKPLFTIGVQDLTVLAASAAWQGVSQDVDQSEDPVAAGWLACTSDELLATKYQLSEYRIRFPTVAKASTDNSPWPTMTRTVTVKQEEAVRATQRDLHRWQGLTHHLHQKVSESAYTDDPDNASVLGDDEGHRAQLLPEDNSTLQSRDRRISHESTIVEPLSWAASLNRWSTQSILLAELEQQQDQEDLDSGMAHGQVITDEVESTKSCTFLHHYFHDLTKRLFSTISRRRVSGLEEAGYQDQAQESDDDEHAPLIHDSGDKDTVLKLTKNDMVTMGLDIWSPHDVIFVKEVVQLYFGRKADIEAAGVEVCGLKIC